MSKRSRRNEANRAAAAALAYAQEQDEINRNLAIEQDDRRNAFAERQFAHAQGLDQRNLERADEQDARRDGIVSEMMADADVSDGELGIRLGDASSDVTKSFLKARGITNRNLAKYGINPADGRYAKTMADNESDLMTADVAARNRVRTGVRNEEKTGRRGARLASLGLSDTSLRLNNNQLQQNDAGANTAQLGLTSRTGRVLNTASSNANAADMAKMQEPSGSGWGSLIQAGATVAGAYFGGPAGAAIGSSVGGAATGGGGSYGSGYRAPGESFETPGAEGTGFHTY